MNEVLRKIWNPDTSLARMAGDRSLLAKMISFFLEDSESLLKGLEAAFGARDFPECCRSAHSLKGLCLNFDAFACVDLAAALESNCRSNHDAIDATDLIKLRGEIERLRRKLAEWTA